MGFRLTVKGQNEEILLDKESILDVKYMSETPDDSNARQASLEVISAGQMVRKIDMTNVFVVDYIEEYGSQAGTGTFSLKIKQKKEKVIEVAIEGGYAAQEEA